MKPSLETTIGGLFVGSNKVVTDGRGSLFELVPGGIQKEFFHSPNIGNIYASKAVKKYVPRAGHYHSACTDIFLTISGTVLWHFEDFRAQSRTYGRKFAFTCSDKEEPPIKGIAHHARNLNGVPLLVVPTGVYHLYFPLTDEPALVLGVTSLPYDSSDYHDPIPDKDAILASYLGSMKSRQ
ncbi:MAG: dTDP-4-dehydrorhamnose 3,5-epimerase family protein [Nitrososphaerota archaeon]|nr:dTDP-4-dehydrorhamnose 3,5-epimerase family protein [Nitrososphaerota archaeon]